MVKYGILLVILIEVPAVVRGSGVTNCDSLIQQASVDVNLGKFSAVLEYTDSISNCENDSLLALAHYYRGCAFLELDSIKLSLKSFDLSLKISEGSGNKIVRTKALLGRGLLLVKVKDFVSAEIAIKEGLQASTDLNNTYEIALGYERLGKLHFELANFTESFNYYQKSNDVAHLMHDTVFIANSHQNLCAALIGLGDLDRAEFHIKEAITFYKEIDDIYLVSEGYRNLLHIYSDQLRLKEAQNTIHDYLEYTENADVVMNAQLLSDIVNIQSAVKEMENESNINIIVFLSGILLLLLLGFYLNWRFLQRLLDGRPDLLELQSLVDRIEPFLENDEKHKAMTYVLLSIKMTPEEIGSILYRDRSTIQHWMKEMRETLGVIDIRADAIMHGSSVTYSDSIKRFVSKLSKLELTPDWKEYLKRLFSNSNY